MDRWSVGMVYSSPWNGRPGGSEGLERETARGDLTIDPLLFLRMKTPMDLLQVLVGDVCIYLCGRDRGVAEHRLDGANVGAVCEKIGGEAMS